MAGAGRKCESRYDILFLTFILFFSELFATPMRKRVNVANSSRFASGRRWIRAAVAVTRDW